MSKIIKVFLADDHTIYLESMEALIKTIEVLELVGTAKDGNEVVKKIAASKAEILLCDYYMPGIDGVELIFKLRELNPEVKVLMLTSREDADGIKKAIQAGARGFLSKRVTKAELIRAILTLAEGYPYYSEAAIKALADEYPETNHSAPVTHEALTAREIEIIKLISREMTGTAIAEKLNLSIHTIATHRKNIFRKLGVNSAYSLIKFAIEHRLV